MPVGGDDTSKPAVPLRTEATAAGFRGSVRLTTCRPEGPARTA